MAAKDEKKKDDGVINAVYKVNLHCPQCARQIKKPLMSTQGVENVEMDTEKGEVKVRGKIDPVKIQKSIEKLSKKKVELISPKVKISETTVVEKKVQEVKPPIVHTTKVKVRMHCEKCEHDLQKKLLKHKGIYTVKTDMKSETLTVEGTIEPEKLLAYIKKKVHKHAEIIPTKPEKVAEAKKPVEDKPKAEAKKPDEDKPKVEAKKPSESTEIVEFKEEVKVEVKSKEGHAPYFIHYVYAPQLFSDENPNACCIM